MNRFFPILILILAMCSIQFGASVAKKLFPIAGTAGASSLRLMFASIMMVLAFRPWRVKFSQNEWKSLALYGVSLGLMNLSFYYALQKIPLGIAVALEFTGPLAVAIFSSKRKIDYLWVVLAAVGIFLLLPKSDGPGALDPMGMFFALLAGFFWALYIIFGKKAGDSHSGGIASAMGMGFAAIVVLPFGLAVDASRMFTAEALPLGLFIALFGSAIPYSLEMMALKKMPTKTFGVLMSLEPAVASLMGLIFLSEHLSLLQWTAIMCVIISSLGSTLASTEQH
ncbi:EamA family transporter [Peredibacter starrii]|uniref:EamA family transporter n=1 Tax=Peredibacter starrii TaxID=28202 RepID=A0AAX4HT33_9BACT|nr:EamA family transporter [Peredibacter starrii]WPU66437.1 EamA family transporter [Peredibacter starrii]